MSVVNLARAFAVAVFALILQGAAIAQPLSMRAAVALAEKFIAENGYTKLSRDKLKATLDSESLDWGGSREKVLAKRFNSLNGKAIGIKMGSRSDPKGWSIAFDYADGRRSPSTCRVVTMNTDGSEIVMQHVEGIREYFAGFE